MGHFPGVRHVSHNGPICVNVKNGILFLLDKMREH